MKINRITAFFLSVSLLCLPFFGIAEKKPPITWDKDSQAVYDLLVAQLQNADADYANSVDTLVKFAKEQKHDPLFAKAYRTLLQTERYAEAVEMAEIWKKNSKLNIDDFYVIALVLNNESDKALAVIKETLQNKKTHQSSQDEEKLLRYVHVLISNWYHPEVLTMMTKLYDSYPDNTVISKAYVNLLRSYGNIDRAGKIIDKLLFKKPDDLALLQYKSDIYRYGLQLKAAEKVWTDVLKDYPNNTTLRIAYARFLYGMYNFQAADEQLQQLATAKIDTDKDRQQLNRLQMQVAIQLGQYAAAEKALQWSHLDAEEQDNARYDYAKALLEKKQYTLALKQFAKIGGESKLALPAALKIGQIHYVKSLDEGNRWFADLQEKYHLNNDAFVREKAQALMDAGRKQTAYKLLNDYLHDNPQNEEVRYVRALIAAEMYMEEQSIEDLKRLHATSPDNTDVQNALGYTLLSQPKELSYATQLIKKSLFHSALSPAVVDSMGWSYYQHKQYKAALPYFRYAYGRYLDGEIIGHYIMGLVADGQKSLAKKLYRLEMQYEPNREKIKHITQSIEQELSK
ncbi:MAG: hypothetical protein CR975_05320 [Gammaproteobacteria bacterium]|nr:MAG: hypothetical protein CR975_05320 [Gammaproteobacteria bacterium]